MPALVDQLDAVAIGVKDIGGVIAWVAVHASAGRAGVRAACRDGCKVEGIDRGFAAGDKADVDDPGI